MSFYHSLDTLEFRVPSGEGPRAKMHLSVGEDGRPSLTVTTTAPNGKSREKVHTPKKFEPNLTKWAITSLVDKTILDLLRKGLVGLSPSPGTPDILVRTEVGPPLRGAFAIDERRGIAWLGDWGWLRRLSLGTGAVESISLGEYPATREVRVDKDGGVWILTEYDVSSPEGQFRAPAASELRYGVFRFDGRSMTTRFTVRIPLEAHERVVLSLSIAEDGAALVPHEEGVVHVRADGTPIRAYSVGKMKYWGAQAALSPNGRWIAITSRSGEIETHDTTTGETTRRSLEMDDVTSLAIRDDGVIDVGMATPGWDFQRLLPSGRNLRIDAQSAAYATSPDGSSIYSSKNGVMTVWDLEGKPVSERPIIAGQRGSRMIATDAAVYLRTSAGVFQRLSLHS